MHRCMPCLIYLDSPDSRVRAPCRGHSAYGISWRPLSHAYSPCVCSLQGALPLPLHPQIRLMISLSQCPRLVHSKVCCQAHCAVSREFWLLWVEMISGSAQMLACRRGWCTSRGPYQARWPNQACAYAACARSLWTRRWYRPCRVWGCPCPRLAHRYYLPGGWDTRVALLPHTLVPGWKHLNELRGAT